MSAIALCACAGVIAAAEVAEEQELESIVVTATRSGNLVRDEPIRVEVLPQEEIAENLTLQPGNLTTLLNELGGVRMQRTAPSLGGSALQMRGLSGRHTLVLEDGLPLLGAQTDSFGLLQTPPLDLGRVELIKGVGSALYGGAALGGVLNLVSRQPDGESELLLNRTSRGGTDAVGFGSIGGPQAGATLIAGVHDQSREDIDHDAWADLPGYRRYAARPRFFLQRERHAWFATLGYVDEGRRGGTMPGRTLTDGSTVRDGLQTERIDGGLTLQAALADDLQLGGRWSAGRTRYTRDFDNERVRSALISGHAEASLLGHAHGHAWLVGLAAQYEQLDSDDAPGAQYRYFVPGLFVQDEFSPHPALKLAASARLDAHDEYGTFVSPRLSALLHPGEDLSIRVSLGTGFAAPTPMLEEIEATSLARLEPLRDLRAERAANASLDLEWQDAGWEINASLFASSIRHPLVVRPSSAQPDRLVLVNDSGPRRVAGAELLLHRVVGVLHFIGSATWLDAREADPAGGRRDVARVPRLSGELAALFEDEDVGRIGIELGYTGRQALDDDPYRTRGKAFIELGVLAELRFGRAAIFFNAENLTNVRQSRHDPLLRPAPLPDGRRTVDLWAPVAGRLFNAGIRLRL